MYVNKIFVELSSFGQGPIDYIETDLDPGLDPGLIFFHFFNIEKEREFLDN